MKFRRTYLIIYITLLPIAYATENINIGSISVISWMNIFLFAISIADCCYDPLTSHYGKLKLEDFFLLVCLMLSVLASILSGWPLVKSIVNASVYCLPFTIKKTIDRVDLRFDNIIRPLVIGFVAAGLISIGIFFGVIDSRVSTGVAITDMVAFNYSYVDGAAGVLALLTACLILTSTEYKNRRFVGVLCGIMGVIILLFYQSRGRIVFGILITVLMLLLNGAFNGLGKQIRNIVIIIAIAGVFTYFLGHNDLLNFNYERIIGRLLSTTESDKNWLYRLSEIDEYWGFFKQNPIFGKGWGALNNAQFLNSSGSMYRAHNMYMAVIGVTGLSYAPVFIIRMFSELFSHAKQMLEYRTAESVFSVLSVLSIMCLGITNAGFGKLYGIEFMIVVYAMDNYINNKHSGVVK